MATKKPDTTVDTPQTPEEGPESAQSTVAATPVAATPATASLPTPGHHGLSEDEARRVAKVKADFGSAVTYLNSLRDSVHDSEAQRAFSVAITNAETASMWAVRAITWRG